MTTLVGRNTNEVVAESGGILESGGRFCAGAFGTNRASVALKTFSHLTYFIKTFINALSVRFAGIVLQKTVSLFNTRTHIQKMLFPVNFGASRARLVVQIIYLISVSYNTQKFFEFALQISIGHALASLLTLLINGKHLLIA